jgi:hypothetical protein
MDQMTSPKKTRHGTLDKNTPVKTPDKTPDGKTEELKIKSEIIRNIGLIWLDENVNNNENRKH